MSRFTERHLDPGSRLGEILFGLIMVLSVTLMASFTVADGKKGVRQLLLAAIGSNVAWGIIDATMYIMNTMVIRRGKIRLVEAVQRASDPGAALALVKDRVEPELQELLGPEKAEAFSKSVLTHIVGAHIKEGILTKEDFYGALASFGWSLSRVCRLQFRFSSSASRKLRCGSPIFFLSPASSMWDKNGPITREKIGWPWGQRW